MLKNTSYAFGLIAIISFAAGLVILINQPYRLDNTNMLAFVYFYCLAALNAALLAYTQKLLSSN